MQINGELLRELVKFFIDEHRAPDEGSCNQSSHCHGILKPCANRKLEGRVNIRTSHEGKRGCGYRKAGAMYLVCHGVGFYCGVLPIPLTVCPVCHGGIKPARGFTWIDLGEIRKQADKACSREAEGYCMSCPVNTIQRAGLIWVGEACYKTPGDFNKEAAEMGVSRRIRQVPRGFVIGETWVALAHRKAVASTDVMSALLGGTGPLVKESAGIFHLFRPSRIEYIVKKGDSKKKLKG